MSSQDTEALRSLIREMKSAFLQGKNAMEIARNQSGDFYNTTAATLIAYDLQAGAYVRFATENSEANLKWCLQLSEIIRSHVKTQNTILEVGCGEATTLSGIASHLKTLKTRFFGFDLTGC